MYQSQYNLITRKSETSLFPTLRELGMTIQVYSPIAGGFLAKTPAEIEQSVGRWDPTTAWGGLYNKMYNKPSYLKMLAEYGKLSEECGVDRAGMAYRWIRYHSALKGEFGDTIVIGSKTAKQLEKTLVELEKGPLEEWVVKRLNKLWDIVEADAPVDAFNLEG